MRYLADRVMVMYLGQIVEQGTTDQVFAPPYHPYTEALLSAVPIADTRVEQDATSCCEGEIPSAMNPPPGCPFQTRCPRKARSRATSARPWCRRCAASRAGHQIKCHLPDEELAAMEPVIEVAPRAGTPSRSPGATEP